MSKSVRTTIGLSGDLHDRLKAAAAYSHRSVHAQMLIYIERGLDMAEGKLAPVELLVLGNPKVMTAIAEARDGNRSQLRHRELRPWPEQ